MRVDLRRGGVSIILVTWLLLAMTLSVFAQAPVRGTSDAAAALQSSSAAMQGVQSLRFSMAMEVEGMPQSGTVDFAGFKMNGEIELPDRVRIGMAVPGADQVEVIVIGETMFARMSGGAWEATPMAGMFGGSPMGMTPGTMDPAAFGQYESYFDDLTLTEAGPNLRIGGRLDLARLLNEMITDSPAYGGGFGRMPSRGMTEDLGFTVDFQVLIDRATRYMSALELRFSATSPTSALMGAEGLVIRMSYFDYDDPTIRIEAPIVVRAPARSPLLPGLER